MTDEQLDEVLGEEKYMTIINAYGWDPTKFIPLSSKNMLLHKLMHQEVVQKRDQQILQIRGLITLRDHFPHHQVSCANMKSLCVLGCEVFPDGIVSEVFPHLNECEECAS